MEYAIGLDLGGTKADFALVTSQGESIVTSRIQTHPEEGSQKLIDRLADEVLRLQQKANGTIAGIGIGTTGFVDVGQGVVISAINLGWENIPLRQELRLRLGTSLPVYMQIDTNASVLGEYYFGAGQNQKELIYISIGTGLGGGIIANGKLISGAQNRAGAIGHWSMPGNERLCPCGLRGCPETILSGSGLVNLVREIMPDYPRDSIFSIDNVHLQTPHTILTAAQTGDMLALQVLEKQGDYLGLLLALMIPALNPQKVIIGGGLGLSAYEYLIPATWRTLRTHTLPVHHAALEICPAQLTSPAIGSACLVWHNQTGHSLV